ncbi:MAG: DEAD/DEAH box helicase [Sarcina sp.]
MVVKYNKRKLNKLEKLADKVIALEEKMSKLSDINLKIKTLEFKERLANNETLDDILVEAFAVAREVSFRILGKKHYKVQIMGGIALHQGKVAEMKNGEGKTLTALCPAYLNALTEKGVHIMTVNEYLAKRDKEEMESFFNFLGLEVGLVTENSIDKKIEYAKDVVYATNIELGFDYLKDNLAMSLEGKVQRELNYVIIDEIDSILIDEAKNPLTISGDSDGVYQYLKLEKNGVIKREDRILAKITYQNFLSLYNKVAGMSGTVETEELEFREMYNLDILCIPTNKPIKRIDYKDKIYIDNRTKIEAIITDIIETHKNGNPILVGAPNILKSEEISNALKEKGIEHQLLNAKTKSLEAEIISKAGQKGAITVTTNIAGRGTDIKISDEVENLGGLKVIGTERIGSRRIDNHLIGRAGRQGNRGMSQFYLSCDDELLKTYIEGFSKKKIEKALKKDKALKSSYITKTVEKAQKAVENIYYESRKYILRYDFTVNKHRKLIYKNRDMVLGKANIASDISELILEEVFLICAQAYEKYTPYKDLKKITRKNVTFCLIQDIELMNFEDFFEDVNNKINEVFHRKFVLSEYYMAELKAFESLDEIIDCIANEIIIYLNTLLENQILSDQNLRLAMIDAVDNSWIEHLDEMEFLKKVVKNQNYNKLNPIYIYKLKSGQKFIELNNKIRERFISNLFSSTFEN